MAHKIAMLAIALIMTISMISVAATAATGNTVQMKAVGNYAFNDNASTSTIYNLSYKSDSGSTIIANSVVTAGTNSTLNLGLGDDAQTTVLNNVTLNAAVDGSVLLLSTHSYLLSGVLTAPSMIFSMSGNVSLVNLTTYQSDYLSTHSSGIMKSFVQHQIYRVDVNGSSFFIFSNYGSTTANNKVTYAGSSALTSPALVIGISTAQTINDKIHQEVGDHNYNQFFYNNSTGQLNGRFLSMQFNSTTGVISNFMDAQTSTVVFSSISTSGNGSIGGNFEVPISPASTPIVVGGLFFYANNTAVYQIHDNPTMVTKYYISNGTTTFQVASGLNVTKYHPIKGDIGDNSNASLGTNLNNYTTNVNLGDQFDISASPTIVLIHNSTFTGSLFVGKQANVTVSGNTVQIHTNTSTHATFVAPPGIQGARLSLRSALQYGIEHGKLAAVVVLGQPGQSQSNVSVNYNSSVQISVQNVNTNSVSIHVSGRSHEGTNIAFYVPNGVINANSTITVKFDNQTVSISQNANGVINATSSTKATFFSEKVNGGTLVILHVPHFSSHTIEITNSASIGTSPLKSGKILYIGLGVVAIIAVLAAVTLRRRKS